MANALREEGRPVSAPAEPVEHDEMLDDSTVEEILETNPEALDAQPPLSTAIGIRNAVVGGVLFWALAAGAYLVLR